MDLGSLKSIILDKLFLIIAISIAVYIRFVEISC